MTTAVNTSLYLNGEEVSDEAQLVSVYTDRVRKLGLSSEAMFYADTGQHQKKLSHFATLVFNIVLPDDTVLDVGCGFGSLAPLLPPCTYSGIDIVSDFILHAKSKYPLLDFRVCSVHEDKGLYDWCIVLGVVNSVPDPKTLLSKAWEKCKKGVIVDFIDSERLGDFKDLNRFDMGSCLAGFLDMGAGKVEVIPTGSSWTIFIVTKPSSWLQTSP